MRESPLIVTRFPAIRAPIVCTAGSLNGKLKGDIMQTGPNGHLYPVVYYPGRSPLILKDFIRNLQLSAA